MQILANIHARRPPAEIFCAPSHSLDSSASFTLCGCSRFARRKPAIEGKAVAEVRVVDESGKPVTQKIPPLPLEAGKPFDFTAERASLRELYRMGDYANIKVTSAAEPGGGLRIDFIAERNFYNNVIQIVGIKEPPSNPAALAAVRLNLGEAFRESSLREAVARLQNSLRDDGLYEAKVSWKLFPDVNTREMDVTFTVDQGPRARVGAITIDNSTPYPDAADSAADKNIGEEFGDRRWPFARVRPREEIPCEAGISGRRGAFRARNLRRADEARAADAFRERGASHPHRSERRSY